MGVHELGKRPLAPAEKGSIASYLLLNSKSLRLIEPGTSRTT
jgi:hypothetical protein